MSCARWLRFSVPFENAGFALFERPLCCTVFIYHCLTDKTEQTVQDLHGETLLLMYRDWSHYVDRLRDDIRENHSQLHIMDFFHPLRFIAFSGTFRRWTNRDFLCGLDFAIMKGKNKTAVGRDRKQFSRRKAAKLRCGIVTWYIAS